MPNARSDDLLQGVRTLFDAGTAVGLSDAQLLERFAASSAEASEASHSAEAAFAALVARHGPMVLGVCRRVLSSPDDVEDAFQATFLVLVRRAGSVRVADSLGRWLHGVARRVAVKARVRSERRSVTPVMSGGEPVVPGFDPVRAELLAALDEELGRLPGKYQAPVVLSRSNEKGDFLFAYYRVTISCRAAQAAISPLRIAVAINSGNRLGVHAKLGTPSAVICAASRSS
jgi:HlyD family secretion protein